MELRNWFFLLLATLRFNTVQGLLNAKLQL
jgi:hypothetical protein